MLNVYQVQGKYTAHINSYKQEHRRIHPNENNIYTVIFITGQLNTKTIQAGEIRPHHLFAKENHRVRTKKRNKTSENRTLSTSIIQTRAMVFLKTLRDKTFGLSSILLSSAVIKIELLSDNKARESSSGTAIASESESRRLDLHTAAQNPRQLLSITQARPERGKEGRTHQSGELFQARSSFLLSFSDRRSVVSKFV